MTQINSGNNINSTVCDKKTIDALDKRIEKLKEKVLKKRQECEELEDELCTLLDERYPERKTERIKDELYEAYIGSGRYLDEIIDLIENADKWI